MSKKLMLIAAVLFGFSFSAMAQGAAPAADQPSQEMPKKEMKKKKEHKAKEHKAKGKKMAKKDKAPAASDATMPAAAPATK